MTNQIEVQQEKPLAKQPVSIIDLMQVALSSGITPETMGVMKELIAMRNEEAKREAEMQYNTAFVRLQSETGKIEATKAVHNSEDRGGGIRYHFAPFEEIMDRVQPLLNKYNFGIEFDSEPVDGRLVVTCTLSHTAGHSRSSRFAVRYTKPPGSSEAQGDMSTLSYAKRGALCSRLNIRIGGMDNDGADDGSNDDARTVGNESATVTPDQAVEIKELAEATNSDVPELLKWAGVDSFDKIPASKYPTLHKMLKRKEAGK